MCILGLVTHAGLHLASVISAFREPAKVVTVNPADTERRSVEHLCSMGSQSAGLYNRLAPILLLKILSPLGLKEYLQNKREELLNLMPR